MDAVETGTVNDNNGKLEPKNMPFSNRVRKACVECLEGQCDTEH